MHNGEESEASAAPTELSETIVSILEPHFERFTKDAIRDLIVGWRGSMPHEQSSEEVRDVAYSNILILINAMINQPRDESEAILVHYFSTQEDSSEQEGYERSRLILDVISRHCTGELEEGDPILEQCSRLSSLSNEDLRKGIGTYFRNSTENFLLELCGQEYVEAKTEVPPKRPSSTPRPSSSSPSNSSHSSERQRFLR